MKFWSFIFLSLCVTTVCAQQPDPLLSDAVEAQKKWVDSLYQNMTLDEKVGQLFVPMVFSEQDEKHFEEIKSLIVKHHLGGLIFSLGSPDKQSKWLNEFQSVSKIPLLISMDAEWGVAMRLDSVVAFPWNMTLGAAKNEEVLRKIGQRMGEQEKALGVHMSYAPVLDINTNPNNPIIGNRSFGESPTLVARKGLAIMRGHHDAGRLTSGKHFPGHGDTAQDSHKTLPTLSFDRDRIENNELLPFKKLIENGISSIMVAHLNVPALTGSNLPTSLSYKVVTELLKEQLGFNGLIVTDALNMKGASDYTELDNIDLAAFIAGNDVLLISNNIPLGIDKIKQAVLNTPQLKIRLEESVKKILKAKYKVGLSNYKPITRNNLLGKINTRLDSLLIQDAFAESITLLKNDNNLLPLDTISKYAHLKMGDAAGAPFVKQLKKHINLTSIELNGIESTLKSLAPYEKVIVSFHRSNETPWKSASFSKDEITLIKEIGAYHQVILDVFVKPYALKDFKELESIEAIVVSYQNSVESQEISADILAGLKSIKGKLPVSISTRFPQGSGIFLPSKSKIDHIPLSVSGVDRDKLKLIDQLAQVAIDSAMTPGLQIFISRKGKTIYKKSFGYHTYEKKIKVANHHVYDLASLTKILATLPLLMQEFDDKSIKLESKMAELLPKLKNTNKSNLTIKAVLSHYAKLTPWIPFYKETLDENSYPKKKYFRSNFNDKYRIPVAKNLYLKSTFLEEIDKMIIDSPLLDSLYYKYSDLSFYLFKDYLENKYDESLDILSNDKIYEPLGLKRTLFKPLGIIPENEIVPSEYDRYFRHSELKGYVHDMGAALLGGVGGHAGLFSNAEEVARIMQLYLNKGYFEGKRYFNSDTFDQFNQCYYCSEGNRRGVGFDKPQLEGEGSTCGCVSLGSFGHMGFTGTYAWADPEKDLIYVFLSNRTYPTMDNNLLGSHNIRTRIQQLIYDSIIN